MSKLAAIKRQIAALEAEAERITRQEMSGAIAKVKEIMATFGLTIEHLHSKVTAKSSRVVKKAGAKRAGKGVAKYADPATGKTWSGFGRAPAWIAGAKSREAFLVSGGKVSGAEPAPAMPPAKKKSAVKKALANKPAKPAAKKAVAAAKKGARKAVAPAAAKRALAKKPASKVASKKSAGRKVSSKSGAATPPAADGAAV